MPPKSKSPSSSSSRSKSPSSSSSRNKSPSSSSSRSKSPSSSSSRNKSPSSSSSRNKSPSSSSSRNKSPRSSSPRSSSPRSSSPRSTRKHHAASKLQRTFRKTRTRGFCSICYRYYNTSPIITLTNCKHTFHQNCINDWFKRNNTCPMCREITIEGITNDVVASDVLASPEEINRDQETMINVRRALAEAKAARPLTRSAARPLARAKARHERDMAIGNEAAMLEKASANKAALIQAAKSITEIAAIQMEDANGNINSVFGNNQALNALRNADAALEELNVVAALDKLNELSPRESLESLRTHASTIKRDAENLLTN